MQTLDLGSKGKKKQRIVLKLQLTPRLYTCPHLNPISPPNASGDPGYSGRRSSSWMYQSINPALGVTSWVVAHQWMSMSTGVRQYLAVPAERLFPRDSSAMWSW
jgi:hypothetical protein